MNINSRFKKSDIGIGNKTMIHKDFNCDIYFIRHGESESNATPGLAAGVNFDASLTKLGHQQAKSLGERFKNEKVVFDNVFCSTLTRAIQTTENIFMGMDNPERKFHKVPEIIEQQIPGWRGVPTEEAYTNDTMTYIMEKGKDFVGPDGESIREVQKRATNWLEDELIYNRKLCSNPQSLKVAIIGHGNTMRSIFHYIMGFDQRLMYKIGVDNTSISRFIFNSKGWSVVCLNDNSHLKTNPSGMFETRS